MSALPDIGVPAIVYRLFGEHEDGGYVFLSEQEAREWLGQRILLGGDKRAEAWRGKRRKCPCGSGTYWSWRGRMEDMEILRSPPGSADAGGGR